MDMHKLEELIGREIDKEVAKGSLTPDSIRTIGYAVDVVKDLREIEKCDKEMQEGYSGHYPQRGYNIMPYYSYDDMDGRSYQRRDSMGRYSRDGGSYREGYSRDEKIDHLEKMMNEAKDPEEKEMYRKLLIRTENGN